MVNGKINRIIIIHNKKDYNTFTRLMLQLEMIQESQLEDLGSLDVYVEQCMGLVIEFQLETSSKNKNLNIPKISSIKIVNP